MVINAYLCNYNIFKNPKTRTIRCIGDDSPEINGPKKIKIKNL